jgi:aspartate kinase
MEWFMAMSSKTLVMKFGGASIGTTTALSQVLGIVMNEQPRWDRLALVVSALDGVTDALIDAAQLAQFGNERAYRRIAGNLRARHLALAEGMALGKADLAALQADVDRLLFDLLNSFQRITAQQRDVLSAESIDEVVCMGERLAARIIAVLLRQHGLRAVAVDADDLIVTDEVFGSATPLNAPTQARINQHLVPMLERGLLPVLTGFIGATSAGKPTTLGRGGSDYSASVFAVATKAQELWVWSDVDGIMTADPYEIESAQVVQELSYAEMAELAYFGARILHARMVAPLQAQNIPLRVKNVYKPQAAGTLIHKNAAVNGGVKSVTQIAGISLNASRGGPLSEVVALVNQQMAAQIGLPSDVMITAQSASRSFLCFVVPTSAGPDAIGALSEALGKVLSKTATTVGWHVEPVSMVTLIGEQISSSPHKTGELLAALGDLPVLGLSFGPGACSMTLVVREADSREALRRLHTQVTVV